MTSNGNTAQKHLIKILTETHQEPKTAYDQAIATAPSKHQNINNKGIKTMAAIIFIFFIATFLNYFLKIK